MPLAVAPGAYVFLVIVILLFVAVIVSSYTRRGSGISEHPTDGRGEAPGASGPAAAGEADRGGDVPVDFGTR